MKVFPYILVVEDSAVSAQYLKRVLMRSGFEATTVDTVAAGFTAAIDRVPELILLDIMLPDGDGFSLCARMQASPELAQVPIIFVTGLEDVQSRVKGLSSGAVDFITKPFAAEEIVARVRIHIKIARQSRLLASAQSDRLNALRHAQKLFLTDPDSLPEARCAVYYESVEEAGGDQYDIVQLGSQIYGFLVADIAGHGMETVFQASALKALFRENASSLDSPSETLYMINRALKQHLTDGQHLTAFYLILNRQANIGSFASAGHFPALAVSKEGVVTRLTADGDVVGVFAEPRYQTVKFNIEAGSRYWLYTDGIIEDFGSGSSWQKGLENLEKMVAEARVRPLKEALSLVRSMMVPDYLGTDDRTLMVVDA
jgi:sigma-B regulation protein RsbU (phosphoserine phosphatase)